MSENTVAAISTPLGTGGISVIRISGDAAISIADKCFRAFSGTKLCDLNGYEALYGEIYDQSGVIDDCVALVFKAPKSYTGENVVEISTHGGVLVTKKALRAIFDCGATPAMAGEFTKRAFLNGKLDLLKAESVIGIINAKNESALKINRKARNGGLSKDIDGLCEKMLETAASIAAYSDFPDEDIENLNIENFSSLITECESKINKLIENFDNGKAMLEGIDCAIVGKPNVGKSTIMNLFSRSEKSIVTDIAGTTRDIIENTVNVNGITLNLADTAGIRNTEDTVEKAGVQRAIQRQNDAQMVLAVFDNSAPLDRDDKKVLCSLDRERSIVVLNKSDLKCKLDKSVFDGFLTVQISAKYENGIEDLAEKIKTVALKNPLSENDTLLITERQRETAVRAQKALKEAKEALFAGVTVDAVGVCLDDAISALLELTGKKVTEEVCNQIFERFCIGK